MAYSNKEDNLNKNIDIISKDKENINKESFDKESFDKEKISLFSKFISKFKKEDVLPSKATLNDYSSEYSKFREYLFLLDESENDEKVLQAIEYCDNNLKLDRHLLYLNKKNKEYETSLKDIQCYDNLSLEEAENLKNLISKYVQLSTERKSLRYQLGDFNNSINKLDGLKEDATDAVYQIEDAENSKRSLSHDIAIIKDEKERTLMDREKLQFAYNLVYKFALAICIILTTAIIFLTIISISTNQSMFIPLSVLCITLLFTIILIYAFRKKIIFEIKLNEKKQAKLVSLLNKKTVVYSYYINFLNFAYNKYNVKNARTLKTNLEDFNNYKHILTRYDNLGKLFLEIQTQLEDFIFEKNITISNASLESFAKSINVDNKISYFKETNIKKEKLAERIAEINKEHKEVWDKLLNLNLEDSSKEKVIDKIIKAYLNESQKIVDISENIEENNN